MYKIFRKKKVRFGYIKLALCVLVLSALSFICCQKASQEEIGWSQVPEILSRIIPPNFPAKDFIITDCGAIGNGQTDCTDAFKEAIETCHAAGGGRVVVPEGIYLTGAIHLKSNVNLHLRKNAIIRFSQETKKYLPVVYTRFEGVECRNYSPFVYAYEQENIAVTGEGTLDGRAMTSVWWAWKGPWDDSENTPTGWDQGKPDQRADVAKLQKMANDTLPVQDRIFGEGSYLRPNFIQPYRCKNVLIEGVTIKNSPMWVIHPVLCSNVTIKRVIIESLGPNNDGCNPESCTDVFIKDCYFNTGDDCIAIKSGRNADGRRVNVASENIVIQGCQMKNGHGGVTIGSEVSGNIRNVFAEDCVMDSPHLERALRIKTNSLRGGIVENIFMRNITVGEVSDAVIRIFFHYGEGDVGQHTPEGYKRSPISNIFLEDCKFEGVAKGNKLEYVVDLKMKDVYINGAPCLTALP